MTAELPDVLLFRWEAHDSPEHALKAGTGTAPATEGRRRPPSVTGLAFRLP
jgi:hypothetical protein